MNTGRERPILLSPPDLGEDEFRYVREAFESNWIAPVGPNLDAFEQELSEITGCGHACALSSGTAAIHLGLLLLGVRPGDLVLCSSLTFVASANPIRYCGAEPVLVDSEPDTWCMSPRALETALERLATEGRKPRACIAVSLYGQAADLRTIEEICRNRGVKLMDEAAEAVGAVHGDRMAGTFGDLGVYSFNGNKIITTSGGGALVSADEAIIREARDLASQARDHSPINAYEHSRTGYNYRLSNVLAGIGRGQLKMLDQRILARRRVFARYQESLKGTPGVEWMPEAPGGRSTRWLSCLLVQDLVTRDRLLHALQKASVDARPVWKPMHQQPLFKNCRYQRHQTEHDHSASVFERGICLPSGSSLEPCDQDRVIEVIRGLLD